MKKKTSVKIGYARVSSEDQNLDLQKDALNKAGCRKIFWDKVSGKSAVRVGLTETLEFLTPGDTLVVWRLDRLGRSLKHLIETVTQLEKRKIGFCSLQENIDTTTSSGKLIFHMFGALAEFERGLIQERTAAGLKSARARGRLGGRKPKMDDKKLGIAKTLLEKRELTVSEICSELGIGKTTLYRHLNTDKGKYGKKNISLPLSTDTIERTPATNGRKRTGKVL